MIIGEIIEVRINGKWYEAEILEIGRTGAYVYVFDLRKRRNIQKRDMR